MQRALLDAEECLAYVVAVTVLAAVRQVGFQREFRRLNFSSAYGDSGIRKPLEITFFDPENVWIIDIFDVRKQQ